MILIGNIHHGRLIAELAGADYDERRNPVLSRINQEGQLLGGVYYSDFTGTSMRIHMAGTCTGWASPDLLWMAFDYPFNQLHVDMLLATVKSSNEKAMSIDKRLGFKEVYRFVGGCADGDLVMLSMLRDECRWIRKPRMAVQEAA